MKKIIGLIVMVFALTLVAPQAGFAEAAGDSQGSSSHSLSRSPQTIDYAVGVIITLNQEGFFSSSGTYMSLLRKFSNARSLAAEGKVRPARNMLNAAGSYLHAQSGKQIDRRVASLLKSIIVRIKI